MSKHETANQFKDGLMMDVHPLQTPNTVLTDCLNGTFITYNGNEHVLQNDMGNFKLEKCKLKENYIPIGTASYGDILYIASYNPIDKKFEIGSYPSPLQWNSSGDDDEKAVSKILKRATDAANKSGKSEAHFTYSELAELSWGSVLDKESLKINPGDKYKIEYEKEASDIYIEEDEFFILDENNTKQEIKDIELNKDFKPVSWQVPGYLGITSSILTPYEHNLYIMSTSTSPNLVSYKLRSVISIYDDRLLTKENLSKFFKNLKLDVDFFIDGNKIKSKSIEYSSEEGYPRGGTGGFDWHNDFESREQYQWLYDKKQLVYEFGLDIPYVVTPSKYTKDDLENRPIGYVDENDYNFPLYKFIQPLDPGQEGYYEYYERPTEIRCVPVLRCDIPGNIDASYYGGYPYLEIEYDTLQGSVTYTANGADRNDVAASVFTWKYNEAVNDGEKDYVTINADVFTSSEEVTMSAFFKPVDELLTSFTLPTQRTETSKIYKNEYINFTNDDLTSGNIQFALNDVAKYTYYVVFFLFLDKKTESFPTDLSELDNNLFIARFIYTGDEEDQDGRADRKLSLQKEVDKTIKSQYSNKVSLSLNWNDSTYTGTISKLMTTDSSTLPKDLFFNTDVKSGTITQTIKSKQVPSVDKENELNINLQNSSWRVPIVRRYCNSEDGNYVTSLSSVEILIDIIHSINPQKKDKYYDFSDVTDIIELSSPPHVEIDWATKSEKAQFVKNGSWNDNNKIYSADKTYSHEGLFSAFDPTSSNKRNQFKSVQLGAYRIKGSWSRIFSNSAKTAYLTAGDKGEASKVFRTFLMARYGTGNSDPKFCLIQFPGLGGNDTVDDFNNIIANLRYFDFSSSPEADDVFVEKWIWEYSISAAKLEQEELNKKYTLYEKLNYSDDPNNKVYSWIYKGSPIDKLKCDKYCTFDNYSKIEKINFTGKDGETEKYAAKLLTTDITMTGSDPFTKSGGQKELYETAWNAKTKSENETASSNQTKYAKYLDATGVVKKNNMYCIPDSSDTVKTFAKYLTPSRDSDNYMATLSSNYPCTKKSNFYFGCTTSGTQKSILGYIPAFLEWLP